MSRFENKVVFLDQAPVSESFRIQCKPLKAISYCTLLCLDSTLFFMVKHTILCVDDEIDNVDALERLFRAKYNVLKATSGRQALEILDQHQGAIAAIITDQRMPEMTGVDFLTRSLDKRPDTIRMLLTGYTDVESVISAVNSGKIYRYLTKPWDPTDLMNTVDKAVELFTLGRELEKKNSELEKAYTELKTLDQAKTQFMILINHELKTPLTSILSFTELLKETRLTEEQDLCAQRIQKSSDRLKNLIDDVLVVIGAETKTLKAKIQAFEGKDFNIPLSADVQKSLKAKNQKLVMTWPDKKILGDQSMLTQVFHRLIHNATKFGKENSDIRISHEMVSPHRIKFSITNEGSSISTTVIDKILKPFFIDEDVMNHSTGMGLGLTICQSILKLHSSSLDIQNVGSGAQVSFEIACL